jgi:hypothetical protein
MIAEETTARALVEDWIQTFTWTTVPTLSVQAQAPQQATQPATEEGDAVPALPTMAFRLGPDPADEVLLHEPLARDDSPSDQIVYELGRAESAGSFVFKCRSQAEAETFKREFRDNAWVSMAADGDTKMPVVKRLDGTFLDDGTIGVDDHVRLFLSPTAFISHPSSNDTAIEDLWVLRHACMLSYPLFSVEPAPGSGRMDVVINHLRCSYAAR